MDCRRTLATALYLLTGALGCAHDTGTTAPPLRETAPPPLAGPSAYNPSKRTPQAATCVAGGNFLVGEAAALDKGSSVQENQLDKARKAYQQALSIDPNYIPAYQSLARLYVMMEDYDHAVATYRQALKIQPRCAPVWFDLGVCQSRWKEWPGAIESLGHAVEYDPENRLFLNRLACVLAYTGRYQDSLSYFQRSYGNEAMAHYQLARAQYQLKQDDLCRQSLQTALQRDPNLEPAQALLNELGSTPGKTAPTATTITSIEKAPASAPTGASPQQLVVPIRTAAYIEEVQSAPETNAPAASKPEEPPPAPSLRPRTLPPISTGNDLMEPNR